MTTTVPELEGNLHKYYNDLLPYPMALVVPARIDVIRAKDQEGLLDSFRISKVLLPVAKTKTDVPIEVEALLIQIGIGDITYNQRNFAQVEMPSRTNVAISVRFSNPKQKQRFTNRAKTNIPSCLKDWLQQQSVPTIFSTKIQSQPPSNGPLNGNA